MSINVSLSLSLSLTASSSYCLLLTVLCKQLAPGLHRAIQLLCNHSFIIHIARGPSVFSRNLRPSASRFFTCLSLPFLILSQRQVPLGPQLPVAPKPAVGKPLVLAHQNPSQSRRRRLPFPRLQQPSWPKPPPKPARFGGAAVWGGSGGTRNRKTSGSWPSSPHAGSASNFSGARAGAPCNRSWMSITAPSILCPYVCGAQPHEGFPSKKIA